MPETITIENAVVVEINDTQIEVVSVGTVGPPGSSSAAWKAYVTSGIVPAQRMVALINGMILVANPLASAHANAVIGMSRESAGIGESCIVDLFGPLEVSGPLAEGLLYLGVSGALVAAPPANAAFVLEVGRTLSATSLLLDIQTPIMT